MAKRAATKNNKRSFRGTFSRGSHKEVSQNTPAAPTIRKVTRARALTSPIMTDFDIGDIKPHATLAVSIAKWPASTLLLL